MDLRLLNTFVSVAKLNSFTQAAEQLGYAQSSVTSQIQALEGELNVKLLERLGKNISLTQEGERFLPYATQMLKLYEQARGAVAPIGSLNGTLTIGAPESLSAVRLLPVFTEFHKRHPDVDLTLKFGGSYVFLDMLRENKIDVAFYIERDLKNPDLVSLLSWPEEIVLLACPEHPLCERQCIFPRDLADQQLILSETGCSYRNRLLKILSDEGVTPKGTMESDNVHVMVRLASSGVGVAFLPLVAALEEIASEKLVRLEWAGPAFEMKTHVVYHKDKWLSAEMKTFIALAEDLLPL